MVKKIIPKKRALSPTAYTILGYLALQPRSGYEIREAAKRSAAFFWGVSDGQLYPMLRVLDEQGLIASLPGESGAGPKARVAWELTSAGRDVLNEWLAAPSQHLQMRDENLVKLLFASHSHPEIALRLLAERQQSYQWFAENIVIRRGTDQSDKPTDEAAIPAAIREYGRSFADNAISWCEELISVLKNPASAEQK